MKDKLKKYLLPNLPYLFFVYLFDKLCQTVRLAPGLDASEKLLHIGQGFQTAFSSSAPSFHALDICVGILGAVFVRLAVYVKGKNAKKYRKGMEYGSARWGTAADIAPYTDPVPDWNIPLTRTESLTMTSRPKDPKTARNKNILVIGGSGSGKTRFFVKPSIMQMHSSYVITDPKGQLLKETGKMLLHGAPKLDENGKPVRDSRGKVIYEPYRIKVLNTINFSKSMKYNPLAYVRSEKDILKLVNVIIANTKGDGEKSSEDFWVKAERLLYCALIGYIWYEAEPEERNFIALLYLLNACEAREDDETYKSPVDILFDDLAKKQPEHFAVKQYVKFKMAAGVVCSKRLLNQAVGKSLRTHNLKPKKGAQVMRKNEKITALYERLSRDDFGKDDDQQRESNSISNQELICKGWFLPPNTYDCGSFVVNGTAVVGKESKHLITAGNQHTKELIFMKSLFDQMGGTYHQEGDYLIPNLTLPDEPEYQIGKYGRMRRSYLKAHRPVLYANFLTSGTLHRHLAEIDQACNEHMEIIVSAMAKQESATEALKAADQLEWVRRMNSIRSRAEEIVLTELVYN